MRDINTKESEKKNRQVFTCFFRRQNRFSIERKRIEKGRSLVFADGADGFLCLGSSFLYILSSRFKARSDSSFSSIYIYLLYKNICLSAGFCYPGNWRRRIQVAVMTSELVRPDKEPRDELTSSPFFRFLTVHFTLF